MLRELRKVLGEDEIPVPDGHRRRHKGQTHLFLRPEALGTVAARLAERYGTPLFTHAGVHPCLLQYRGFVLWLPSPEAPFGTVSF